MAEPKFRKGDWVVRVHGEPNACDETEIGDIRQVDEEGCCPFVTHKDSRGNCDVINQDEYRLATPEELERVK